MHATEIKQTVRKLLARHGTVSRAISFTAWHGTGAQPTVISQHGTARRTALAFNGIART